MLAALFFNHARCVWEFRAIGTMDHTLSDSGIEYWLRNCNSCASQTSQLQNNFAASLPPARLSICYLPWWWVHRFLPQVTVNSIYLHYWLYLHALDNTQLEDLSSQAMTVVWLKAVPGSPFIPSPIMDTLGSTLVELDHLQAPHNVDALIKEAKQSNWQWKLKWGW